METYQATFDTWNQLAHQYQEKFMDLDLYQDTYDRFCQLVETPSARVLELGCGPGNITKHLLRQRPDFTVEATDVAPNMVALAQANNPAALCYVLDCRSLDKLTGSYDAILGGFCLPYLSALDCQKLVQASAHLLPLGGILYLSFVDDDPEKSGYETSSNGQHTLFVHYHRAVFVQEALTASGFALVDTIKKNYLPVNATHTILLARRI
ncbi:methyltransferase domain-containing protein [Nibribacter ruber]|uniref:Methyltransferase domain-containing protein n=1 Tax=Nibribacter ruber TaxID=2698458 RepID=A0A6P1NWE4_9BACT|nr:class I SAM-dependent methyltransferase [Nibribacter ruber]QHL88027.1 methyltransferase domain-containing protein [Nibribacter ruber]